MAKKKKNTWISLRYAEQRIPKKIQLIETLATAVEGE